MVDTRAIGILRSVFGESPIEVHDTELNDAIDRFTSLDNMDDDDKEVIEDSIIELAEEGMACCECGSTEISVVIPRYDYYEVTGVSDGALEVDWSSPEQSGDGELQHFCETCGDHTRIFIMEVIDE